MKFTLVKSSVMVKWQYYIHQDLVQAGALGTVITVKNLLVNYLRFVKKNLI